MPGHGFGFGSRTASRQFTLLGEAPVVPVAPAVPTIIPGPDWNGAPGSGFQAAQPVDPVRTSAKPALRLLTPPNQAFVDELVVGVAAAANDGGSLFDNFGLQKVIVHYEGDVQEIISPSFYMFEDVNGALRQYYGWWAVLQHDGRNGHAQLYVEAVPQDPTMQNRVMGPYQFSPRATEHDYSLEVAPSQPVVAGARYQTITAALAYLNGQDADHPLVTVTEPGTYNIGSSGGVYEGAGYCSITASVPITIGKAGYTTDGAALMRPKYNGLRFKGANVTLDFRYLTELYTETSVTRQHWFDGCNLTNSGTRDALWRGGPYPLGWIVRGNPWFTECAITETHNSCHAASLVRGASLERIGSDIFADARCVIGTTVHDQDNDYFAQDLPAMTVTYSGAEATATLERSGGADPTSATYTATFGSNVATFTVGDTEALYVANTNYTFQHVANWINTLPGWSATVLDNSRRAASGSLPGMKGLGFGATNVKDAPVTVVSLFDRHGDWYQKRFNTIEENVIVTDNVATSLKTQNIFVSSPNPARDYIFLNNALYNNPVAANYWDPDVVTSNQARGVQSHVVIAHCSMPNQSFYFRPENGLTLDSYCLFGNNVLPTFGWIGAAFPGAVQTGNHIYAGGEPELATGTTIGGSAADLFVDVDADDFTPDGALLQNLRPALVRYGRNGRERAALSVAGSDALL